MKVFILLSLSCIGSVLSVKLGTYNTYQLFTHSDASSLLPAQVPQLLASDIDIICLQELNLAPNILGYGAAIDTKYPNRFSELNLGEFAIEQPDPGFGEEGDSNSQCTAAQIDVLNGALDFCKGLYDGTAAFAYCLASTQPASYDVIAYSSCAGCLGVFGGVQPQLGGAYPLSLDGAIAFCSAPFGPFAQFDFNVYDGLVIATTEEYPIIDAFSIDLPSWLFLPRKVKVAQICVDEEYGQCQKSILFGCTHLGATGFASDTGTPQLPSQIGSESISSHVGLNRLQSQKIVEELFNDDILDNLGVTDDSDIVGVFLAGDINTGQLFNRCEYDPDNDGDVMADNCVLGVDDPLNPFEVLTDNGLIDAPDLKYSGPQPEVLCTSCLDEESALDDYNPLADDTSGQFISEPDTTRDLDHILVQDGFCAFRPISVERAFLDKYPDLLDGSTDYDDVAVPASDHYAVVLEVEFQGPEGKGYGSRTKGICPVSGGPQGGRGYKGGKGRKGTGPKGKGGKGGRGGRFGRGGRGYSARNEGLMNIESGLNDNNTNNTMVLSSQTVYGIIGIVVLLLVINLICLGYQNCCIKKKIKYNKVAFTSDEEI